MSPISSTCTSWPSTGLGLDPFARQHIATMVKLHRQDRYNRSTNDVEMVTGHPAQTVRDYVEAHREMFG